MDNTIFIVNAIAYILLFFFIKKKVSRNGKYLALLICFVLVLSSLCSIAYFESPLYDVLTQRGQNEISIIALIYLFVGFLIYLKPITKLNIGNEIVFPKFGGKDVISIVIVVVGVLSIIPFLENLSKVGSMSALDFAEAYEMKQHDTLDTRGHLSPIGHFCNGIVSWLVYVNPLLFFYAIVKKKNAFIIGLSVLSLLNPVLLGLMTGARNPLYELMTILALNFILFKPMFSRQVIKRVLMVSAVIGALMIVFLFILTFGRDEGDLAIQQIYRYIGEGFVNFAETGWYVDTHTWGHSMFNGTGNTFWSDVSNFFDQRDYERLGMIAHIKMYVYYTVVGDFFLDFGAVGGYIFAILLASLFYLGIKRNPTSFSSFILINLYCRIGLLSYSCFAFMTHLEFVLFALIIFFLCRFYEPSKV